VTTLARRHRWVAQLIDPGTLEPEAVRRVVTSPMDVEHYRQRLLAIENELRQRLGRETEAGRDFGDGQPEVGDQSVTDFSRDTSLTLATADSTQLDEVRGALDRIDAGTYGLCDVDGEPIEDKRLEAVPWTRYCVKHQGEIEEREGLRPPPTM
jgi:DnaK suppressor protein